MKICISFQLFLNFIISVVAVTVVVIIKKKHLRGPSVFVPMWWPRMHCLCWHHYWENNCSHQAARGQGNAAIRL